MAENSRRDGPNGPKRGLLPPEERVTSRPKALAAQRPKDEPSQSVTRARAHTGGAVTHLPPESESRLAPLARVGRYELLGRLAVGGMAEIFLARESVGQVTRRVALKFIRPDVGAESDFEEMFLNEARVAMGLTHPNICHVYEFNSADRRYYLAMEYVDGVPLHTLLARAAEQKRAVSVAVVGSIFARVAEALHFAHTARDEQDRPLHIVHRDVSPHNVMVSWGGAVKLLDFGVAKVTLKAEATRSGALKGKFGYMSPEQIAGRAVDGRSDVFALGICLYEALVGERLYKRENEFETMRAIMEEPPPSVRAKRSDIPPALDDIVRKALSKSPDDRFATAGDVQEALEGHLAATRSLASSRVVARLVQSLFEKEIADGPTIDRREDVTGAFVIPSLRPPPPPASVPTSLGSLDIRYTETQDGPWHERLRRIVGPILRGRTARIAAGAAVALIAIAALVAMLSSGADRDTRASATDADEPTPAEPETPTELAPERAVPPPAPAPRDPPPEVEPMLSETEAPPEPAAEEAATELDPEITDEPGTPARSDRASRTDRRTIRREEPPPSMRVTPRVVRSPGF